MTKPQLAAAAILLFAAGTSLTAFTSSPEPAPAAPGGSAREVVERFVAAYNRHEVEAMLALAHPEIQWLSVEGEKISVETAGVAALGESMRKYFRSLPSSRSSIEGMVEAGRFVSVRERARWEGKTGERTQSALAVYEVEEGRVRRVWYYPVQP
jgi:hypothetical protein